MPHPRRINNMAGTSTPYEPGGPERRARITSNGSMPGAQQHQQATPGRGAAAQDQLKLTGNTRFRARATPHRAHTALREQERRLLNQERRLVEQGSHAVDWVRATTAGTFWARLNAVDFMNSSLQFAALAVLCRFPFLITVSAESGGDV